MSSLESTSLLYIALTQWVPPLITILVGGGVASIVFPRLQSSNARYHAREQRRIALAEEISQRFLKYISAWRRLRKIAELEFERENGLTPDEFERKKRYISQRDESRDELMESLCSAQIVFSRESTNLIDIFIEWDDGCGALRASDLPNLEEWINWRRKIVGSLIKR